MSSSVRLAAPAGRDRRPALRWLGLTLAFAAGLSLIACSLNPLASGPAAPCTVTTSQAAADRLSQKIKSQESQKSGSTFTVTATNEEVTSLVNQSIDQAQKDNPDITLPIEKPVVCFKPGTMSIFGGIKPDANTSVNALITVSAAVSRGKAAFKVDQVQLGQLSVPGALGDAVSALVSDALNKNMDKVQVSQINIQENQLTISGQVQ